MEDQQKQLDLPATMPCSFALPHKIWTSELETTFHCSLSTSSSSSPFSLFCCYTYLWHASCYHSLSHTHNASKSDISLVPIVSSIFSPHSSQLPPFIVFSPSLSSIHRSLFLQNQIQLPSFCGRFKCWKALHWNVLSDHEAQMQRDFPA